MAKRYTEEELKQLDDQFKALIEDRVWAYLVVEPSLAARRALVNALKKAGAETILEAKDGMDALLVVKKAGAGVVAVTELNMPVMDGLEFMRQFRADPMFASCPVIFMSAETRKEKIIAAVKSGAAAYLKKPFEPQVLVEKLQSLKVL
jgi:two-component system, chemotaxis family, chemotaxis protein CheY